MRAGAGRQVSGASLLLAASALLSSNIGAQTHRPYRPAFDVSDYVIAIDIPDSGATIHAKTTLTVTRTARADTLTLDLLDLSVNQVTVDGRRVKFVREPEQILIPLPSRRGAMPTYTVAVDYGGAVKDGLIARVDSAGRSTYFGDNWPNRARHWIPSIDHPSDKATVTWRVTAPTSQTVVANGKLVSTRRIRVEANATPRTETVWREARRIPVYLMVIAVAPRLFVRLMHEDDVAPIGERAWGESALSLPENLRGVFVNVLTGAPFASVTVTKTFTSLTSTLRVVAGWSWAAERQTVPAMCRRNRAAGFFMVRRIT